MRHAFVLIVLYFLSVYFAEAQKIKTSELDKYSKKYIIETSFAVLKSGMSSGANIGYRSIGQIILLRLQTYGSYTDVIDSDGKVIFLLENDSTVTIGSKGFQSYEENEYRKTAIQEFGISKTEVEQLMRFKVVSFRIYHQESFIQVDVEKNGDKLQKISEVFLKEFDTKLGSKLAGE
jgi:hypothetical protein